MWQPHFRWYYGGCGSEGRAKEDEQAAKANHRIEEAGQSDGRFFYFCVISLGLVYLLIVSH